MSVALVMAGQDRPLIPSCRTEITFLEAGWPAEAVRRDNLDSGRKKYVINQHVLESGGGLLMFLDADDWVDVTLVAAARATIGPDHIGGLIDAGFATDVQSLRAARLPHPRIFDGEFHRICGSSTVANLRPDAALPLHRNPYEVLHEHYRWKEVARENGVAPVRLPVLGNYVINTRQNHSEHFGPFARWRRDFNRAVDREGQDVDAAFLARFGLTTGKLHSVSERFFASCGAQLSSSLG